MTKQVAEPSLTIDAEQIRQIAHTAVRRAAVFMAIGFDGARHETLSSLKLDPAFPVSFVSDPPNAELLRTARINFGQWVIGNSLRELTQGFVKFLDRSYEALLIIKNHRATIKMADFNKEMSEAVNEPRLLGKLERIETAFGLTAKFKDCFPSISLARDSLSFNQGVVRDRDCNADGTLKLSWFGMKSERREKEFKIGETIDLSTYDLSEICWTFAKQSDELIEQMVLTATFKGMVVPTPDA